MRLNRMIGIIVVTVALVSAYANACSLDKGGAASSSSSGSGSQTFASGGGASGGTANFSTDAQTTTRAAPRNTGSAAPSDFSSGFFDNVNGSQPKSGGSTDNWKSTF